MGANTIGENALRQALISKAGKAKMEEREGGRDWAKGAKAKDTEARVEKDMASKAKERAKIKGVYGLDSMGSDSWELRVNGETKHGETNNREEKRELDISDRWLHWPKHPL